MPKSAFRPNTSFSTVDADGVKVIFTPTDLIPADHWVIAGRESLFEPVEDILSRVEQATAAPGEKRSTTRRPSKKSGASSDA